MALQNQQRLLQTWLKLLTRLLFFVGLELQGVEVNGGRDIEWLLENALEKCVLDLEL